MALKEVLDRLRSSDDAQVQRQLADQSLRVRSRLASVRRKLLVLSGKGGVGKSTVTALLARALARRGRRVGILDADLNGSSIPRMLGLGAARLTLEPGKAVPPRSPEGIAVAAMSMLAGPDSPVRWKGPLDLTPVWLGMMESGVIREFLADVDWGALDDLLCDMPPGAAADKPPVLSNLIPDLDGALIVTTPSEVAIEVVRKSVLYARDLGIRPLGLIVNMAAAACPHCGGSVELHAGDAGELAAAEGLPVLARVPLSREVALSLSSGEALAADHPVSRVFDDVAKALERAVFGGNP